MKSLDGQKTDIPYQNTYPPVLSLPFYPQPLWLGVEREGKERWISKQRGGEEVCVGKGGGVVGEGS